MHLAIYLPGGAIPGQDPFAAPLAHLSIRALEDAGATVVPVRYDDNVLAPDRERFEASVRREIRGALSFHQPDRVTMLGKSRGTHALRLVCIGDFPLPEDTRLIWQTPVWKSDESWEAARSTRLQSLYIVGLADQPYHDSDRHAQLPGETVSIAGADHGLEIAGDVLATIDAWRTNVDAIVRFAGRR
jgi:hypothetical protein